MTGSKWSERYIEKDMKVFDTWKGFAITRELDRYSLTNIVSHLNQLGELIDNKIKQGQYMMDEYNKLKWSCEAKEALRERCGDV